VASTRDELFSAIDANDAERVRASIAADPSLTSARDDDGVSALLHARYRSAREIVELLRARVSELDLFEASALGDVDRVTELVASNPAAVADRSTDGFTPLHLAAYFGKTDVVRALLDGGADRDALGTGWMRGTALHSAVSARHADVVAILLDGGADPNARQAGGWTPLHGAAHNGDHGTTELLLAHGADPSAVDDDGRSALDHANERGDASTIAAIRAAIG
jgi:ankyrin repeat protein